MAEGELPIRPLRRAEYDQLVLMGAFHGERIELLEGKLVHMSPIGPPHSSTVDKLLSLCVQKLSGVALVRCQNPFAAQELSEPEPDFAIVPLGDYETDHPTQADLLIEVADSSLAYDRGPKLRVYAEAGVPEYWIVNLVNRRLEVHRKPSNGRYWRVDQLDEDALVTCERYPALQCRVGDVLPRKT